MSLGHGASIVRDGLIIHVDAANVKSYTGSGLTATDIASNKTMNFTSGVDYSAANRGSFYFNTSGEIGSITSAFSNVVNSTWEAWVKLEASTNTYNMFMGNYSPYFSFYAGNRFFFSMVTGGSQRSFSTLTNKTTGVWYNPVVTLNYDSANTNAKFYVNGVEEATATWAGSPSYSGNITMGEGRTTAWYPFNGYVSSIKLYNKTLSQAEVKQNFEALRGRYGI